MFLTLVGSDLCQIEASLSVRIVKGIGGRNMLYNRLRLMC